MTEKYPLTRRHYMRPMQKKSNEVMKSNSRIIDELEQIRLQIIRIGTNVNQIAKHVNSSHNPDTSVSVKSYQLSQINSYLELIREEVAEWKPK